MDEIVVFMIAILFFILLIIVFSVLAFCGYCSCKTAFKNNPESTRQTGRDLIIGIMGGTIVAIITIIPEQIKGMGYYSFFILYFVICSIILLTGAACRLNVSYLKDESSAEITVAENNKATIKISDGRTHELKVEKENGKLNMNYILNKK